MNATNERDESNNPYAAPQAELQRLPTASPLQAAVETHYMRQGIVAGLQMGGFGASIPIVIYVVTWSESTTAMALVMIAAAMLLCCTVVGFLVGLVVQLFAILFGVTPTDSVLPALPFPSLEPPESTASQELDKIGQLPPPMI